MALLIDTSVLIAMERRGRTLGALATVVPPEPLRLSAVVAAELLAGVELADTPARKTDRSAFVDALLGALPVLPFDLSAARAHAVVISALRRAGNPIGTHDAMIAATALANGAGVLTDNADHFGSVRGLRVVQPAWDAPNDANS